MIGKRSFDIHERFRVLPKGDVPTPPPVAPVARQPLDDPARAAEAERDRQKDRRGYSQSVLANFAKDDESKKTVLG